MIVVTPEITIEESELEEKFIRASGPGGQNVNKLSTAIQLRFDVQNSPSLPEHIRERLKKISGNRLSSDGVLTIEASRFRTQEQNREDARQRLIGLIQKATYVPKPRRRTKPTKASQLKRVEKKRQRGEIKRLRRFPLDE